MPFVESLAEVAWLEALAENRDEALADVGRLELEEHVELMVFQILPPGLQIDAEGFADDNAIVMTEDVVIEAAEQSVVARGA